MRDPKCLMCVGDGSELCSKHKPEAEHRAEQWNVPVMHAAWQLAQAKVDLRQAA